MTQKQPEIGKTYWCHLKLGDTGFENAAELVYADAATNEWRFADDNEKPAKGWEVVRWEEIE